MADQYSGKGKKYKEKGISYVGLKTEYLQKRKTNTILGKRKHLQSSLYESWLSTPILHLTLTGTFVFAAITDMASATNFPCKRQYGKFRSLSG